MKRWSFKILSILLLIGMLFAGINVYAAYKNNTAGPEDNVFIQLDGENIESVSINIEDILALSIYTTIEAENLEYHWEILADHEKALWVPIYDCNSANITISYGMISNLLDENNFTQLRAVVTSGEDAYISDSLLIEAIEHNNVQEDETILSYNLISFYDLDADSFLVEENNLDENMVTITINYMKHTGEQICDPYVATIYKNMHFATTVLSPKVIGYEPKLSETATELAEEYVLDYDSVEEDVVINIYYYPIEVKYEVRYYMQNIYEDDYTMMGNPIVSYGKVGEEPDPTLISAEFDGFVRVNYQPELIAADGSTVFQCFYDRKYCLINLDLNGGYGVDSVYAKYGTPFIVNTPIKEGFIFDGWDADDDEIEDKLPSTVPSENQEYTAIWEKTMTTYTVVFWREKADSNDFEYWGQLKMEAESASIVDGENLISEVTDIDDEQYFTFNKFLSDTDIVVEGDGSTVVNVYYNRNYYTVYFYAYGKCDLEENHAHTDECYNLICSNDTHTHTDECKRIICEKPENHTHTSTCNSYNTNNVVYALRAKYNSMVAYEWPTYNMLLTMDNIYKNTSGQVANASRTKFYAWRKNGTGTSYVSKRTQLIETFCTTTGNGITKMQAYYKSANTLNISYYFESFDTISGVSETRRLYNGIYYDVDPIYTETLSSSTLSHKAITGMSAAGTETETIDGDNYQYLYYDRQIAGDFSFHNVSQIIKTVSGLKYGQPLSSYQYEDGRNEFIPPYPEEYEDNAYEFVGWYTTPECFEGTQVDWDTLTMPLGNLTLYAKWVPKTHTVTFYNTYQDMIKGEEPLNIVSVPHGNVLESTDVPDTYNEGYIAGEWFYIKNGEKVAYRPISIAVKSDLKVYRDWTSNIIAEYTVYYYKIGTTEAVADPSTGWMFDGATKTFKAKGGGELGELYDAYSVGWYPTVSSTSVVADKDSDNIIIFYYDYQNPNPYTVKYVDADTGQELVENKVVSNNTSSVVTEVYKAINGYVPDAYYKQLILCLNKENDPDLNTINFYYTRASNSAYYAIEYYFMNTDGETYHLNAKIQSPIAIGSAAIIPEVSTEGYLFKKCLVKDGDAVVFTEVSESDMNNVIVQENGALIKVYYEREKTSYIVHYYISGTETPLKNDKFVDDIYFGTVITEEAGEVVENYTLVSDEVQTKELVLDPTYNVFAFYYEETLKTANYKAICRDERFSDIKFGSVSSTLDIKRKFDSYSSVTIYENDKFYFTGWYSDEELTNLISTEKTITPDINADIAYYAVFEPYLTNLTITKSVDGDVNDDQTFVFKIRGLDDVNDYVNITVTIQGEGEVKICDLPLGNYKVIEDASWSWKYNSVGNAEQEIELTLDESANIVRFTNSPEDSNWLNDDDSKLNIFN